MLNCRQA